jgi:alpha-beta hydrolase superfamily lysophospholipase
MDWLAERDIESSVFDFRGHGRSAGRRGAVLQWTEYLEDLDVFMAHLEAHGDPKLPLFLLGHSHGGLVAVAAALRGLPQVAGIILSAPYLRRRVHVPLYKDLAGRLLSRFFPAVTLPTGLPRNSMTADEGMLRESEEDTLLLRVASARWYVTAHRTQAEVVARAAELYAPLLVLTGDADPIADPRGAHDLFVQASSASKQFRIYPGFLHEILRERGRETVYSHILTWLREQTSLLQSEPTSPRGSEADLSAR